MQVKLIFFMVALLSSACSGEDRKMFSDLKLEDRMQFILFDNGREIERKELTFEPGDKKSINSWLGSFAELSEDYNTYAPGAILLGKKIKVNFQQDVTVISIKAKADPTAVWSQYSRVPTKEDKDIVKLLRELMQRSSID